MQLARENVSDDVIEEISVSDDLSAEGKSDL